LATTVGYDLTCNLRATVGYTFIHWCQVARAGDQIDRGVNPSQLPPADLDGAPRPRFDFVDSGFWAQGLHFGLEYHF
jgi:hypothetical protein